MTLETITVVIAIIFMCKAIGFVARRVFEKMRRDYQKNELEKFNESFPEARKDFRDIELQIRSNKIVKHSWTGDWRG